MGLRLGAAFGSIRWLGPMDYHLNQQGKTVGVFPLEELRRRRNAGELTGSEFVWCEGMPAWQSLDAVLQQEMTPMIPVPPPLPKPASKVLPFLVIAAVVVVAGVVLFGIVAVQSSRRLRHNFEEIVRGSGLLNSKSAFELASKPIQWSSNTVTAAKMLEQRREFRVREFVESYEKYSEHNPAYDADALQLLKSWIDSSYSGEDQTNSVALVEMSDKLAANPACNDPLALTATGSIASELHESVRRFERALKAYEHSPYHAYARFCATVALANDLARLQPGSDRVRELDSSAKQLLKKALEDGSIQPGDQSEVAVILMDGWGARFFDRNATMVTRLVESAGKPFQWLALVLEGKYQVKEAWKARGSGFANTVTAEGWKGFAEHLAKARVSYSRAWELRPDLALAPDLMIDVSMGESNLQEMRLWFDRTVAIQIDYAEAWSHFRWGLRPRWYGSHDAMLAFGVMAANTRRFDTDVPRKLLDSVGDVESELDLACGEHIYGRPDIWPHLQQVYEGYIADPSQVKTRDGWRSAYAVVAYFAEKYQVARAQLEAIHWQPRQRNLVNWGKDVSLMALEVAARTGVAAQQVEAAESKAKFGEVGVALRMYTDLSAATNTDERTQAFVRERLTTLGLEQRFQAADWVDFLPMGDKLAGWTVGRGKFTALPGALEVQSDQHGHIIYSRARVGTDFEVKGTFDVVQSSTGAFQAGLVIGIPQFESRGWYSFRIKRNPDEGDIVSFARGWNPKQLHHPVSLNSEMNTFYFRLHRGLVYATVNDKEMFRDAKPPEEVCVAGTDSLLGLGAFNDSNDTVIRYRDVQVRKLSAH